MTEAGIYEGEGRPRPLFYMLACYFSLCFLLGGGVQNVLPANVVLQLLALPLVALAVWRTSWRSDRAARRALLLLGAGLAIPLLQLIPLPPAVWQALPMRAIELRALEAVGAGASWRPISMAPARSWLSLLAMIPPVAVFATTLMMGARERRLLAMLALLFGLVNAFLGLLQLAQGAAGALWLYEDGAGPVGLFANRNHLAALLYALVPLAAAFVFAGVGPLRRAYARGRGVASEDAAVFVGAVVVFFILTGSGVMTRSRAGVMLTLVAAVAAALVSGLRAGGGAGRGARRFMLGLAVAALFFTAQYGLYFLAQRFTVDPLEDARFVFARVTAAGAWRVFPFGAGLGSFVPVYMTLEKPPDVFPFYANHAHNDYLELLLETGLAGAAVIVIFLVGLLHCASLLWRARETGAAPADLYLARGALLAVGLLLLHSFVDYPLRTEAVLCLFAFCCALALAPPAPQSERAPPAVNRRRREAGEPA